MKDDKILASFIFLREMAKSQALFTLEDLAKSSGWTEGNTSTNISKRLSKVVLPEGDKYRVDRKILSVTYDRYASLFKQKRNLFVEYSGWTHTNVTVYEFFLPLTLEHVLRQALDELFYKDTVMQRLTSIGVEELVPMFMSEPTESEARLLERVCKFVEQKFVGYSISHVDGRFRAGDLLTKDEVRGEEKHGKSYIIDETTAVVKFVIPHSMGHAATPTDYSQPELPLNRGGIGEEIELTRWLFRHLFVEAVLQATTDQDEIWLLENGQGYRLYRYVALDRDDD